MPPRPARPRARTTARPTARRRDGRSWLGGRGRRRGGRRWIDEVGRGRAWWTTRSRRNARRRSSPCCSCARSSLRSGVWSITLPSWLGLLTSLVLRTTLKPAASSALVALSAGSPTTGGTVPVGGADATTIDTVLPGAALVLPPGLWLITFPAFTVLEFCGAGADLEAGVLERSGGGVLALADHRGHRLQRRSGGDEQRHVGARRDARARPADRCPSPVRTGTGSSSASPPDLQLGRLQLLASRWPRSAPAPTGRSGCRAPARPSGSRSSPCRPGFRRPGSRRSRSRPRGCWGPGSRRPRSPSPGARSRAVLSCSPVTVGTAAAADG